MEKYTLLFGIALILLAVLLQTYVSLEPFTDASGTEFAKQVGILFSMIAPRIKIAPEGEEPIDITIQKVWSTDLNDVQSYLESKYNKALATRATTPLPTTTTDSTLSPVLAQGRESQGK
jgi:hypothetical protein